MFCRSLFVLLYFFFWPLCCLFFFDIRIMIAPLVSSNSSFSQIVMVGFICVQNRCISGRKTPTKLYHIQLHSLHLASDVRESNSYILSWLMSVFALNSKFVIPASCSTSFHNVYETYDVKEALVYLTKAWVCKC